MTRHIRILYLEANESDVELVKQQLGKENLEYELLWATDKITYERALNYFLPDIILCDYSHSNYSSLDALNALKETGLKIPFILLTTAVAEEFVVKMIKGGADDYILKDRLQRLPTALLNAIERASAEKDRERYLNEIISQEKKFRALIENISEAIILVNNHHEIIYQSPSVKRITGFSNNETLNKPVFIFFHADDITKTKEIFRRAELNPGKPIQESFRSIHKLGHNIWLEGTITNLLGDENVKAYIINYRDITERKNVEREREKITSDLILHNKNLEQFAYIVSHNLRSPVANIIGLSNMIQNTPRMSKADFVRCIQGLTLSVKKLDDIIIDLNYILQMRNEINEKKETVRFSGLVKDIKTSISELIEKEKITITTNFIGINSLFTIKSYLNSIFYNLITNSIKYRQPGRKTVINITANKENDTVILRFKDNGMGIDLNAHEGKIFGLYKKFHLNIEGKGMGLYMVKTQVGILGGNIRVISAENEGTEFIIELKL